ncbi:Protein of unknown function [Gryllus bimaculatus]|nr:Protein of unknown function [Gryllus bimaculatus]
MPHENSVVVDLSKEIFDSHQQNSSIPINCRRYSGHIKALCLAIQWSSAKAYWLLRHVFTLPSSKILNHIRQIVPLTMGISKTVLNIMVSCQAVIKHCVHHG